MCEMPEMQHFVHPAESAMCSTVLATYRSKVEKPMDLITAYNQLLEDPSKHAVRLRRGCMRAGGQSVESCPRWAGAHLPRVHAARV